MTKEEKLKKGHPEYAYELFQDLFNTFKESKVLITSPTNKYFAFDIMCGIAEFTSAVLKAMIKSSNTGDKIFDFYVRELLPSSFKLSEELFDDIPTMPTINAETTMSN